MKKWIVGILVLLVVAIIALPWVVSPERERLDNDARALAPGEFAQLSEGQTHYQQHRDGSGPTVVLIHGFTTPGYVWEPTWETLEREGFRVIRYDLYGRGWSDRPRGAYDYERFLNQLDELLVALEAEEPVHLVGLSMGGAIAAAFTARYPERVGRLALVAPFNTGADIGAMERPLLGEWLAPVYLIPNIRRNYGDLLANPEAWPEWEQNFEEQLRYRGYTRAILSSLRHIIAHDAIPHFETVGAQDRAVLLVWGDQDPVTPFTQHEEVLSAMPAAEFVRVEGAGHLPHIDAPDHVNRELAAFLRNNAR